MEMKLDVAASGQYRIHLVMAHMPTSGKIRASIKGPVGRGQEEGTGADLYRPYRVLSRNLFLGELELEKGMNMLEIEFTGTNKQVDTPEIGIDFIWLQKVEN